MGSNVVSIFLELSENPLLVMVGIRFFGDMIESSLPAQTLQFTVSGELSTD
jgi:hypothetical protein